MGGHIRPGRAPAGRLRRPRHGPLRDQRALRRAVDGERPRRGRPGRLRARGPARRPAACGRADGGRPARAREHAAGSMAAGPARPPPRRAAPTSGASTAARRPRSTTTTPTGTGCWSTRSTVAESVSAISATFPGINRDVAVTGALLHDIGKLEAYTQDPPEHRPHRRRPPPGRDPARLLPRPPRDRGHRRLPAGDRPGRAAHHPLPPRRSSSTAARSCRARARRPSCT